MLKCVKLVESHRDTTLTVVGARELNYFWQMRAGGNSSSTSTNTSPERVGELQPTATGAVSVVIFHQLDETAVVLAEVDVEDEVTNVREETVMAKYVRRDFVL